MKKNPFAISIIIAFSLLTFFSCKTTDIRQQTVENADVFSKIQFDSQFSPSKFYPSQINWQPLEQNDDGFMQTNYYIKSMGVTWHCIKIDLDTPNLEIVCAPANTNSTNENSGQTFRLIDFARKNKTIAAINTTPFENRNNQVCPVGIIKVENKLISAPDEKYCALTFERTEKHLLRAKIIDSQTNDALENSNFAFGGFFTILDNDTIYEFKKFHHSRSACGISDEGRYLYLFAATPKFSMNDKNGLTYEECALILQQLGCTKAMQFDGGHSTGLCIYNKQVKAPFFQRKIPAAFGIKICE